MMPGIVLALFPAMRVAAQEIDTVNFKGSRSQGSPD
jgi:hypothetical protein